MIRKFFFVCLFVCLVASGLAQAVNTHEAINGWHLLDPVRDGYMGISLDKAYGLLKDRKATTVIVAVIDSGIDTAQEDLRPVLWRNPKEISGNGIDDDHNGYVDDIYGWNFCGSPDGQNQVRNSFEIPRVYHGWKNQFEGKKEKDIPADQRFLYSQWKKAADQIEGDYESASRQWLGLANFYKNMENTSHTICEYLSATSFTWKEVKPLMKNDRRNVAAAAEFWNDLFSRNGDESALNTAFLAELADYRSQLDAKIARKTQPPQDWRTERVKDNYTDINDRYYGNNNLKEGSGDHGTLVAGTIAAVRNNGIGMDGIANQVQIMAVRAVPGGDEHDKDIALAIRYAVDNGASIINMSFGKPVSPYKQFVDDAVKYAASKGVLLIHASGNEGENISQQTFYPMPLFLDGTRATNYLTVGASGDLSTGGYAAPFSNYSHDYVDLFAPGMNIYSTASGNQYKSADGTSLACPVVTGVAALLKSYFPELTPEQLIRVLTNSGAPLNETVTQPGSDKKVNFQTLSSSGRIVNAFAAVQMALSLSSAPAKAF